MVNGSTIEQLDPIEDARWRAFVDSMPEAGPFHVPAWLALVGSAYGWPIRACCVVDGDGDGAIVAGLPFAALGGRFTKQRLVALPFSDTCAPLARDGDALRALAESLHAQCDRDGVHLVIHEALPSPARASASHYTHTIDLAGGHEAVRERYRKAQVLRGVRRAAREGLLVESRTDRAALADFYRLHLKTRKRLGVPTQPWRFIRRLESVFAAGAGHLMVVRDGQQMIAAGVFLTAGRTVVYKYGCSDAAALTKRPNNLLFDEALRIACDGGYRWVNLGRTEHAHESLRAFKLSFGAVERTLTYSVVGDGAPQRGRSLGLARLAKPLIRHGPLLLGRAAGSALHAHTGH